MGKKKKRFVRRERRHTRIRNTRPPSCSCAPQNRRRTPPACAAASAPSRAIRRVRGAPGSHMRGPPERGVARRARSTSARRETRPPASVRIRLHTSGTSARACFRISVLFLFFGRRERDRNAPDSVGCKTERAEGRCRTNPRAARKRQKRNTSCADRHRPPQESSKICAHGPTGSNSSSSPCRGEGDKEACNAPSISVLARTHQTRERGRV